MFRSRTSRVLAGVGATLALVLAAPLAASAHVTVTPNQVAPGSYPTVMVRVPTESDTASTVKVVMTLPTDDPFLYAGYQAVPGWTVQVTNAPLATPQQVEGTTVTEAPATITFTADPGAGIKPGQFQQFPIVLGPVPDVGHVVLPATQTYDDGSVVEWTNTPEQVAADESLEPAPVLYVDDAPPSEESAMGMTATPVAAVPADGTGSAATSGGLASGAALGLGISGLAVAAMAAVIAVVALLRTRRPSA